MFRRTNSWLYLIVGLIIVGLVAQLAANPWGALLPLTIFGGIFFLYKFPPRWLLRWTQQPPYPVNHQHRPPKNHRLGKEKGRPRNERRRRRRPHVKLRVIDGKKKDSPPNRKIQ